MKLKEMHAIAIKLREENDALRRDIRNLTTDYELVNRAAERLKLEIIEVREVLHEQIRKTDYWRDHYVNATGCESVAPHELLPEDLKKIYASIGGKLGKRKISEEQQAKMQAARKRKVI